MLIGATGCSAVDTGSGTGTSDTKSDTQVSVNADLLDATQYKSDKEAADWTIAVVVKDGTSDWFKRMQVGVDEFGQTKTVNVIQKGPANADAASQVQLVEDMINQESMLFALFRLIRVHLSQSYRKQWKKALL